ncbi:MAG: nitrate reductase molybdenum cofactor assembly chaperone [Pseudomonadota bacterium]|nr:nitrate reductase molybdenum cofactor assembly chaperone [Pseudomonadota bacterium]
MTKTLKVLSLLLSYPTKELQQAAPELSAAMEAEGLITAPELRALNGLIDGIGKGDLYDLQARYVFLFDRTRSLSLHLFEHVHGESRDRGKALVELGAMYEENGFNIAARELPDFLPLFLEYLSVIPLDEARDLLNEPLHIVSAIKERLRKRRSPYWAAFRALEKIAAGKPERSDVLGLLSRPDDDPDDLEALDAAWADEPVSFGPGENIGECGVDRLAMQIRAGRRPAQDATGQ